MSLSVALTESSRTFTSARFGAVMSPAVVVIAELAVAPAACRVLAHPATSVQMPAVHWLTGLELVLAWLLLALWLLPPHAAASSAKTATTSETRVRRGIRCSIRRRATRRVERRV